MNSGYLDIATIQIVLTELILGFAYCQASFEVFCIVAIPYRVECGNSQFSFCGIKCKGNTKRGDLDTIYVLVQFGHEFIIFLNTLGILVISVK